MNTIIVLTTVLAVALAIPTDTYDPKYDNFNTKELVDNERLLKGYGSCFLDEGPCTPEASDFKTKIPDALQNKCAKCSPKQKEHVRTVSNAFASKLPDLWERILKKYDPKGEYAEFVKEFMNSKD